MINNYNVIIIIIMILLEEIFSIGTRSKAWRRPMRMMNDDDDE